MARKNDNIQLWLDRMGMTVEEVAEKYREWYWAAVREMGRKAALEMIAQALYTTTSTAQRYASPNVLPAGEFLALVCYRIDKMRGFDLELDDPQLDDVISTLLQVRLADEVNRDAEQLREDLDALDTRERELDKRESQLDKRSRRLDQMERALDSQAKSLSARERRVTDREKVVEKRQQVVEAEEARLRSLRMPTNALELIRKEMRPGGMLAASSTKSLLSAKMDVDEHLARQKNSQLSTTRATRTRVQRQEKEKVLAFLTAPIRLLVDLLMP